MCNCVLTVLHLLTYLCSQAMLEGRGSLLWNCIMRWVQEAMPSQAEVYFFIEAKKDILFKKSPLKYF
jgi:hypothetical protein